MQEKTVEKGTAFENDVAEIYRNLDGATFNGAKLNNVDFSSAKISKADLRETLITGNTISKLSLANSWGAAMLTENLRKQLGIAYRKSGKVSIVQ